MSTIEDLGLKSITEMSPDEAMELLRQIRLNRRTVQSKPKTRSYVKPPKPKVATAKEAADLLKILTGE